MASTGTGKTRAFAIPLIERLEDGIKKPQALVLCPTRELAQQVAGQIEKMGQFRRIKVALIYGGSSYQTQIRALKSGAQIVVATPGRLIDLMEQGLVSLEHIRNLVLDEADEMLSMGFQEALNVILKKMQAQREESEKNIWLFSATMSTEIQRITDKYLRNPLVVKKTTGKQVTTDIEQSFILANGKDKLEVLKRILMKHNDFYGLIFTQTRGEADDLAGYLNKMGFRTEAMHGDKSQNERERILEQFRKRHVQIVTATDVAARGIDVKDLTHVINWSLPWDVEIYIHRIGRTGRNGQKGVAVSLVAPAQMGQLRRIEKVTRQEITKMVPPSIEEIQTSMLNNLFSNFEKMLTNERLAERLKAYGEKLELPEWVQGLGSETLIGMFASMHFPDFFRHNAIQEPQKESYANREGGGRGGYRGGGRRGGRDDRGGERNERRAEGGGGYRGGGRSGERNSERSAERPERRAEGGSGDDRGARRSSSRDDRGSDRGERGDGGTGGARKPRFRR
jgi:ATP-dependent RNA helicase DeaD